MRIRLLGSLPRLPGRQGRTVPSRRSLAHGRRPFLECLEMRAVPSLMTATLGSNPLVEVVPILAASNAQPAIILLDSSGQGQSSAVDGQLDSQQDSQGGTGSTGVQSAVRLIELKLETVNLVVVQYGKPQQDQDQNQAGNGQGNSQIGSQGDGQNNGQGGGSDDINPIDDSQGDQGVALDDSQGGSSSSGATDATGSQGTSTTGPQNDGGHCHHTVNNSPEGQSADQASQLDPVSGSTTVPGNTADQSNTEIASSSDGKTGTSSADSLVGNPNVGLVTDTGTGASAALNSQGSSSEKRQHSQSDASILEAEQRVPAAVQDGKQHSPDGTFMAADEVHNLIAVKSQEPDPHNHNQVDGQSQQQNVADDSAQGPVAERVRVAGAAAGPALAETPFFPVEETLFFSDFPDDTARAMDYANVSPQNHELLTDSLSPDFTSLRAEVRRFFEHIDNLGAHASERHTGMVLCSAAVVVAAALACEVAWRQARRPVAHSPLTLASTVDLADEAEAPVGLALPHFGRLSALS